MQIGLIKLSYCQVIDANSTGEFERYVFEDSYSELLMQAQRYNPGNRFTTFREIITNDPKANSLHYKVGFAIGLYIQSLHKQIPGLSDTRGKTTIPFAVHELEIIQSDLTDKKQHRVAIHYTTGPITLLGSAGDHLLLSFDAPGQEWMETFLLPMRSALTVTAFRPVLPSIPAIPDALIPQ